MMRRMIDGVTRPAVSWLYLFAALVVGSVTHGLPDWEVFLIGLAIFVPAALLNGLLRRALRRRKNGQGDG